MQKGKIVNLEWSLLSSEDLDKWSIGTLNAIGKRNVALKDTILDGGLGPLHAGNLCYVCGSDFDHCTGHFGKIDLFQPCINVLFFPLLLKILPCICIRCSRVLLSPQQRSKLKCKPYDIYKNKIAEIQKMCIKNRNCWFPKVDDKNEKNDKNGKIGKIEKADIPPPTLLSYEEAQTVGYCGYRQPDTWIRFEKILIRPVYELDQKEDIGKLPTITPLHIYNILKNVSLEDCKLFSIDCKLDCFFFASYPISPLIIRPSRSAISQDDLTKNLDDLQHANNKAKLDGITLPDLVLGMMRKAPKIKPQPGTKTVKQVPIYLERYPPSTKCVRSKVGVIPECLDSFFLVQRHVARITDPTYRVKLDEYNSNGRDRVSLKQRYKASANSQGRVREMINGKRVDLSGRSVISPDTYQDANEMGVPLKKAMKWTMPEFVNVYNYNRLMDACLRGPNVYPGANFISKGGERFVSGANADGLQLGYQVER
jgi:DNA-directed RNA polymerase beta' subunit